MPSSETIELKHLNTTVGVKTDLPKPDPRSSIISRLRTILLDIANVPILRFLYGSTGVNSEITMSGSGPRKIFSDGQNLYASTSFNLAPYGNTGRIYRIDLTNFVETDYLSFASGEGGIGEMFSDGTNIYCYVFDFSTPGTYPGGVAAIIKVNIQTFTKTAKLQLGAFPGTTPTSIFSDGTFLYIGLLTTPGTIVKIDISTFTITSTLVLNAGSNIPTSMFGDESFLYAGCGLAADTKVIAKVDLGTFTQVGTLTIGLPAVATQINSTFADSRFLYIIVRGAGVTTYSIQKIDLETFTLSSTISAAAGIILDQLFADATFLYVGSGDGVNPATVKKIDLATFTEISSFVLSAGQTTIYGLFSDETYLYISAGQLIRKNIFPTNSARDRRITKMSTQVGTINTNSVLIPTINTNVTSIETKVDTLTTNLAITDGKVDTLTSNLALVAADVTTILGMLSTAGVRYRTAVGSLGLGVQSGAGAWVKGNYTEAIAVNAIATTFYIEAITLQTNTVTNSITFEVDIATGGIGAEANIATVVHRSLVDAGLTGQVTRDYVFPNPIEIAANTRVSIICSCSDIGVGSWVYATLRYRVTP